MNAILNLRSVVLATIRLLFAAGLVASALLAQSQDQPPLITEQPANVTVFAGIQINISISITATGIPPLSYQWFCNSQPMLGDASACLYLEDVRLRLSESGRGYHVIVSNAVGSVTSAVATVTVLPMRTQPGSLDMSFETVMSGAAYVNAIAGQPDGKLLLAGSFTGLGESFYAANPIPRTNLARLNADGTVDLSFAPAVNESGTIFCIAVQPDGKIAIGGEFTNVNGRLRYGLARLNADGTLDESLSSPTTRYVTCGLAIQPDGELLAAIQPLVYPAKTSRLMRYLASGIEDTNFMVETTGGVISSALAVQRDGKIMVGGDFRAVNQAARSGLARLNADGTVDSSFTPPWGTLGAEVRCLKLLPDSQMLVSGSTDDPGSSTGNVLFRLNPDGSVDNSFTPQLDLDQTYVHDLAALPNGKVVLGGAFYRAFEEERFVLGLNADGSLERSFDAGTDAVWDNNNVESVFVLDDGRIMVGGYFPSFESIPCNGIARLNGDWRFLTPGMDSSGQFQFALAGPVGGHVRIDKSSDLNAWIPLMTVTNTQGRVQVYDPATNGLPQRFYRAQQIE